MARAAINVSNSSRSDYTGICLQYSAKIEVQLRVEGDLCAYLNNLNVKWRQV